MANKIELIKMLREMTGAGMMDCKNALEANDYDLDKAKDWLREKGIATAAKKQARTAAEGLTTALIGANKTIIIEVNCETDFVSRGDIFVNLVDEIATLLFESNAETLEQAQEIVAPLLQEATLKIGEKLLLRRFEVISAKRENVFAYKHMGGKITSVVVLEKADDELARGLAMHIAANNPFYITRNDIPASEVEHEKKIQLEAAKNDEELAKKPENILEKIILGKVNKYFSESTLADQVYLLDGEKKVANVLKEKDNRVVKFVRYQVGDGVAKVSCQN